MPCVLAPEDGETGFDEVDLREEDGLELVPDEIAREELEDFVDASLAVDIFDSELMEEARVGEGTKGKEDDSEG